MAEITYHKSHTFIDNEDIEHSFITQLYKIGVYGTLDNDSNMQQCFDPQHIVKIEKGLKKQLKNKEIKSFELGIPITVSDESGFWEEILD